MVTTIIFILTTLVPRDTKKSCDSLASALGKASLIEIGSCTFLRESWARNVSSQNFVDDHLPLLGRVDGVLVEIMVSFVIG